jgi:16S rRNA (adenine1518-N6/adenine1519-N6)-dimethyltransferase
VINQEDSHSLHLKHKARKRFGQNFLRDPHVIDNIINVINPCSGELLVEIGPGLGALTEHLIAHLDNLQAIELDRDLITALAIRFGATQKLTVHEADALKFDFHQLLNDEMPNRKLRIVGNLPYNISTPLIFHLLNHLEVIEDMHFMLQKEVVDRLGAGPGKSSYGRLSIMIQYYCQVEPLFVVAPHAFDPSPKVDSAIVRLTPYAQKPFQTKSPQLMKTLVTSAFNQRRKTIRNALKKTVSINILEQAKIDPAARPETLSIEDYVRLTDIVLLDPGAQEDE